MIVGKHDTYITLDELAAMIGRETKTIRNWIADGKLHALYLVGVPMIAMTHLENLLTNHVPEPAKSGRTALVMLNRGNGA